MQGKRETDPEPLPEGAEATIDARVLDAEDRQTRAGALRSLFMSYAIITAANVIVLARMSPGRPLSAWLLTGVCVVNLTLVGILVVVTRRRAYGDLVSAGVGVSAASLALLGCAYVGVDSAAVVGLPVLVYYYGLGDSALRRRIVSWFIVLGYAAVLALVLFRVLPREGLFAAARPDLRDDPRRVAVVGVLALQIISLTHWLARKSRRSTLLAMAALERARRGIRQRDALLQEANANLDRVIDGARVGRHTGMVIGSFEVGHVIGRGGVGEVYEAQDLARQRRVAIKLLRPHLDPEGAHAERFEREIGIMAALRSEHVPAVLESGQTIDGSRWLAMELLSGTDLAADLRRRTRLPLDELDELVAQVSRALDAAHRAGVVHRDIKPQNLFREGGPRATWKVLDFGVSKLLAGSGTLTKDGIVGTAGYMAPESLQGLEVDGRADVFALGAVVYRALTGQPAFRGSSDLITMLNLVRTQPLRPGDFVEVHEDVDAVLALALAKDPQLRLGSATALADAWKHARGGALSPALREAAARVLALQPWGYSSVEEG